MSMGVVLQILWTVAHSAQGVYVWVGMSSATLRPPPATAKGQEANVPVPVREFVQTMKGLASKKSAPYTERIVPENEKADLGKVLKYIGPNGLEFVDFDDGGSRDAQRTTIRPIAREHLAKQIQARKGKQLLWLMELAYHFKWWTDKPTSVESSEPGVLLVTFGNDYALTFREQSAGLQLVRLKLLRDAEGGV